MNLSTERKAFKLIIGASYVNDYLEKIKSVVSYGFNYVTILHDKDTDNNGVLKHSHYHLLINSVKKHRASRVINILVDVLGCSADNIQIMPVGVYVADLKYLLHLNDADKYQYERSEISSNLTNTYLNNLLDSKNYDLELTTELLFDVITNSKNRIEIIKAIGLTTYNYYRNTINDILKDL